MITVRQRINGEGRRFAAPQRTQSALLGQAVVSEFPKIKLPKGSITLSGEFLLEKHGGDMWQDLKKWLEDEEILEKMKEIEKEYGIAYVD